ALCLKLRELKKADELQGIALRAVTDFTKKELEGLNEIYQIQSSVNKALNDKISKMYSSNLALEDRLLQLDLKNADKVIKKVAKKKVSKKKVAKKKVAKKALTIHYV